MKIQTREERKIQREKEERLNSHNEFGVKDETPQKAVAELYFNETL